MSSVVSAILQSLVTRYAGYASALGMVAHGVYQVTQGDASGGVAGVMMGWAAAVGLHHATAPKSDAPPPASK